MNDGTIAAVVGGLLALCGLAMIASHIRNWLAQRADESLDSDDRNHLFRRFRRRMQTSGLIVILGVMIAVGDTSLVWGQGPFWSAVYWGLVLIVTLWIVLLALGDAAATQGHTKASLARVRQQQRELEQQVEQLRNSRGNGRSRNNGEH